MICDLTKVFDCVSNEILLKKFYYCGIRGSSTQWFNTYQYRKRSVNVSLQNQKGEFSSIWKAVGSGVPQRSIRGPLLFIIYINDHPYAKPVICLDDLSMLIAADNLNDLHTELNCTLNYMSAWF
jgi:hypothetical protein